MEIGDVPFRLSEPDTLARRSREPGLLTYVDSGFHGVANWK